MSSWRTSNSRARPGSVDLGRPSGPARLALADFHVAAAHQLVEVVAGHVGVQAGGLGHLAGRQPVGVLVDQQVDVAPRRITESRGDGVHQIGEFRRVEGALGHVDSLADRFFLCP